MVLMFDTKWHLVKKVDSPSGLVSFLTLQVQDSFNFEEGQFVMLETEFEWKKMKKPYSISTTYKQMEEEKHIGFVVKKTSLDWMSNFLTQLITADFQVSVKWPVGHYTNSLEHKKYLFIATWSGLSPNVWLFSKLVYQQWDYDYIVNIFWEKTHADIVPEIETLFTQHNKENINNFFHLSREPNIEQINKQYQSTWSTIRYQTWRIQGSLTKAIELLWTDMSCFICWKPEMVDDVRYILEQSWVDKEDITFEKY